MWQGSLDMQRKRGTMPFFASASHFSWTGASLQWLRACWAIQKKNRSPLKSRTSQSLGQPRRPLPPGPRATPMHRRDSDILVRCWILQETEGCLVERLILSATAVSNAAIWGILLAIAQDVFLSYCVISLHRNDGSVCIGY